MDANNTVIWPDQELLVKAGTGEAGSQAIPTPTPEMTAVSTAASAVPTPTLQPTATAAAEPTIILDTTNCNKNAP